MEALTVAVLLVAAFGILIAWMVMTAKPADVFVLKSGSHNAKGEFISSVTPQRSFNEAEGLTFSYTAWIAMNDFTYNYGKKRVIFQRGKCPRVSWDTTSNSILIEIDTYATTESVLISNIPAQKWIHLALVVDQTGVDVYINGMLRQHHTLGQLPKQTDDLVTVSSNSEGWDGVLSDLTYYAKALTVAEIKKQVETVPSDEMRTPFSKPGYFDITWYTGRFNSA